MLSECSCSVNDDKLPTLNCARSLAAPTRSFSLNTWLRCTSPHPRLCLLASEISRLSPTPVRREKLWSITKRKLAAFAHTYTHIDLICTYPYRTDNRDSHDDYWFTLGSYRHFKHGSDDECESELSSVKLCITHGKTACACTYIYTYLVHIRIYRLISKYHSVFASVHNLIT